jgi:hypothetical protein
MSLITYAGAQGLNGVQVNLPAQPTFGKSVQQLARERTQGRNQLASILGQPRVVQARPVQETEGEFSIDSHLKKRT